MRIYNIIIIKGLYDRKGSGWRENAKFIIIIIIIIIILDLHFINLHFLLNKLIINIIIVKKLLVGGRGVSSVSLPFCLWLAGDNFWVNPHPLIEIERQCR